MTVRVEGPRSWNCEHQLCIRIESEGKMTVSGKMMEVRPTRAPSANVESCVLPACSSVTGSSVDCNHRNAKIEISRKARVLVDSRPLNAHTLKHVTLARLTLATFHALSWTHVTLRREILALRPAAACMRVAVLHICAAISFGISELSKLVSLFPAILSELPS